MSETGKLAPHYLSASPDAFKKIVDRYSRMVYGTCCRTLGDPTEAEDVTQDCFEALARETSPLPAYAGAWLHRVATNLCRKRARSDKRRGERERRFSAIQGDRAEIEWDDLYSFVDEAIQELPEKLQDPLIAHYFEGASHEAVAQSLGIPRRPVSNRIAKALQHLRTSLRRRGVTVPASTLGSLLAANVASAAPFPGTLTASLGQLALTVTAMPVSSRPGAAAAPGGLLSMKAPFLVIASVAVVASAVAVLILIGRELPDAPNTGRAALQNVEPLSPPPQFSETVDLAANEQPEISKAPADP